MSVTVPVYTFPSERSAFFPTLICGVPLSVEYQQKFKSFSVAPGVRAIFPESMDCLPVHVFSFHVW